MRIFPSFSNITIVWLHHLDFNETSGEKARWELHKDAAGYFLEAGSYKTVVVEPLSSYLTVHKTVVLPT